MIKKIIAIVFLVGIVAVITFPYWASCTLKYQACLLSCDVRHFNSEFKASACRGGCVSKKVACYSKEAIAIER